jgi:hypothetical protein
MKRAALKLYFNVNNVDAGARPRMVLECVKLTVTDGNVLDGRKCKATPVVLVVVRDWAFAAVASELVKQSLLDAVLVADRVRTHLPDESIVAGDYLLLAQDRVSYCGVCGGGHSEKRVRGLT